MKGVPRVVLDTNVVLSALLFNRGLPARIRAGWQAREFVPVASGATTLELVNVLAYPKFALSHAEQEQLVGDYLPWVEPVSVPASMANAPRCRDPADMPFVHLAIAGKAQALVSGDQDLLELRGMPGNCKVLSVREFVDLVFGR